jgi:protein-S-isoprenylcysteine O-methyltransferase Ste14
MMLKAVSSAALFAVIFVLVALAGTGNLVGASPVLIAAQVSAAGLAVWARRSFPRGAFRVAATPGGEGLLEKGPYRLIRHPMYSAALLLLWSGILAHVSPWTVFAGALATGVVVVRIVVEERLLRERYEGYGRYARTTKALIPFVA